MSDNSVNENEASTQKGGEDGKKDGETRNVKDDKKNEAFVQVSLSIFSGIIGGIATNILDGKVSCLSIVVIIVVGYIIHKVITCRDKLDEKIGVPILIGLLLVVILMFACLAHWVQK
ncbi:hypothetical protein [Campylobacter concisus]